MRISHRPWDYVWVIAGTGGSLTVAVFAYDLHNPFLAVTWVLLALQFPLTSVARENAYRLGWHVGRSAMLDSLGEAQRAGLTPAQWTTSEIVRPATWPEKRIGEVPRKIKRSRQGRKASPDGQ